MMLNIKMMQIILLTSTLISKCLTHVPVNTSDVVIVGGHADLREDTVFYTTGKATTETTAEATTVDSEELYVDTEKEGVLFVPTVGPLYIPQKRNEEMHEDTVKIADMFNNKNGVFDKTEKPGDILFVEGKNKDKGESRERVQSKNGYRRDMDYDDETTTPKPVTKLDCTYLDCNNSIDSLCGLKMERSEKRYRLFLNQCWFRKVNCGFSYAENRYKEVDLKYCNNVGAHKPRQVFEFPFQFPFQLFQPMPAPQLQPAVEKPVETRRSESGRRSMTLTFMGRLCDHMCPHTCPEDYEPECALSANGERRVFANHCKLDDNSCRFNIMWRKRPLAECVGGKKADMQHNRAFINWMQKVGVVDRKGKLVLN